MIRLFISEEYGYRYWSAELTAEEWERLVARWKTMRGLCCLVPVPVIMPRARELSDEELESYDFSRPHVRCHVHEADDSYLQGVDYAIPAVDYAGGTRRFWIDGESHDPFELHAAAERGG